MLLQIRAPGVTMSWDDGFPGARASRPHQAWHSLGHLPHWDQPGTAPWLCFGLAAAVPAGRVAACSIALKLSGGRRDRMRAGRPRSQAMPSRRCRGGCLAGNSSYSAAPGVSPGSCEPRAAAAQAADDQRHPGKRSPSKISEVNPYRICCIIGLSKILVNQSGGTKRRKPWE